MRFLLLGLFLILQQPFLYSQNSSEVYRNLEKLNQFGSVLYIAAHPDDENTRAISFLSKGMHYRVAYLSLTRGDGGQNLIGSEQGEELGVIRTQELIEARKIDGAEQYFTRAYDFGYSKTPEETLEKWNREEVLRDVVWVIRKFKPDVIISRFPTTGEGGHGHHTASAMLAIDAFKAAADSSMFPEQLHKVSIWQAERLLWNTFQFGDRNTTSPDQFQMDVGQFSPLLGMSYGEVASMSRSKHSSQGFGTPLNRKPILEYFRTWEGKEPQNSLMDDIDTGWNKCINNPTMAFKFNQSIISIQKSFDFKAPYKSLPDLIKLLNELENYPSAHKQPYSYWTEIKMQEIKNLIMACAGIYTEITTDKQTLCKGDTVNLKFSVIVRNPIYKDFSISMGNMGSNSIIISKNFWDTSFKVVIPEMNMANNPTLSVNYSQPYWLNKSREGNMFADAPLNLLGLAEAPPLFKSAITIHLKNPSVSLLIEPEWQYKFTDPSKGEVYQPLFFVPPVTITPLKSVEYIATSYPYDSIITRDFSLKVKSYKSQSDISVQCKLPPHWKFWEGDSIQIVAFENAGVEKVITFRAFIKKTDLEKLFTENLNAEVNFSASYNGKTYSLSENRIEYPHIKKQIILQDAKIKLFYIPVSISRTDFSHNIGYVSGPGDKIMKCLQSLGVPIGEIPSEQLSNLNTLQLYQSIVIGIRALNTREDLVANYPVLMQYVKEGGKLIVQYQTNNRLAPLSVNIGPYPLEITRNRVTDENAKVEILVPTSELLNYPYKITDADFEGWVQERGVYFAEKTKHNFVHLFDMADPGEEPNNGSLVYATYGKGMFIYTGLSFFRQLPAGNPGAFKLFLNLSQNRNYKFHYSPIKPQVKQKKKWWKRKR